MGRVQDFVDSMTVGRSVHGGTVWPTERNRDLAPRTIGAAAIRFIGAGCRECRRRAADWFPKGLSDQVVCRACNSKARVHHPTKEEGLLVEALRGRRSMPEGWEVVGMLFNKSTWHPSRQEDMARKVGIDLSSAHRLNLASHSGFSLEKPEDETGWTILRIGSGQVALVKRVA